MDVAENVGGPPLAASNDSAVMPNFLGIGPGRSGSSWLYQILSEHPEVALSKTKETFFFDKQFHRGRGWYLSFFQHCRRVKAIGEVTNTYVYDPIVAQRIYDFNPSMKLISCLRNPIDRAFSHYLFLLRNGSHYANFEDAMNRMPQIISAGRHYKNLTPFIEKFGRSNIFLYLFDDIKEDPISVSQNVFQFLDVDKDFVPPSVHKKVLMASRPRNKILAKIVKNTAVKTRDLGYPNVVQFFKKSPIVKLLYEPLRAEEYPEMGADVRATLREYYGDDVRKLGRLLNKDLESRWFD